MTYEVNKFQYRRYKLQILFRYSNLISEVLKEIKVKMNSCQQLGYQFQKMMENERKCSELVKFLTMKVDVKLKYQQSKFIQVDESTLESVQVLYSDKKQAKVSSRKDCFKQSLQQDKYIKSRLVKEDKIVNQRTDFEQRSGQNQFLEQNQEQNNFSQFNKCQQESTQNEYLLNTPFHDIRAEKNSNFEKQNYQDLQQSEQYFELKIFNKNLRNQDSEDIHNQSHQVKIFSQIYPQHQDKQTQLFNLSNFSSFNGKNVNSNNLIPQTNNIAESQFYQKEFVYLVKKIELMHGKKLSSKGIQRIASQMQSLVEKLNPNTSLSQPQIVPPKLGQVFKVKDVNRKVISRKTQKQKTNCFSITEKKIKHQTKNQQDNNTKSKIKLPIVNIYQTGNQTNKQNSKGYLEGDKGKNKKENDRSVSPLSYRVLMQKKKNQKEKSKQKNQNKNQNQSNSQLFDQSIVKKASEIGQQENSRTFGSKKDIHPVKKQRLNSLKIILDQNSKTKTLCFQYLAHKKNLQQEVQEYCYQNGIKGKHIKLIYQALHQQRPIVTLKEF